ncbi:hypothetical protein SERLA73DRAFT_187076 [Serpula lacrymans var. lacrymans S7.3]|uniref:AB hydrolase-1 domain-containing protein n=1 Tax=Serpula lacrymans var. lacrymans (strain S7.3) TaxID=936435 RepID=F8Q8G1_SERL3|nr:hypothetical protein SERLA73DRAFT_187076 [Serpula lacrymans var. lacrymans S7.3]
MAGFSKVTLPDGIELAYEILGSDHLGLAIPIVLVGGMTSCRVDWERLSSRLAHNRPVLIYDHRGMGDSTYEENDSFTIESLARDLLFLLQFIGWNELAICGHSMGGAITQQLLFLPHHATEPTPLPFHVTHVVLSATLPAVLRDPRYGVKFAPRPAGPLTEDIKRNVVRQSMAANYDPEWFADEKNQARINWAVEHGIIGRPFKTIEKQKRAVSRFDFGGLHSKLSSDIPFLIIHGKLDQILPFSNVGDRPGEIPSYQFGHNWFEYFQAQTWLDAIEVFLQSTGSDNAEDKARL